MGSAEQGPTPAKFTSLIFGDVAVSVEARTHLALSRTERVISKFERSWRGTFWPARKGAFPWKSR